MAHSKKFLSLFVATILIASSSATLITIIIPVNAQQAQAGPIPSGDRAARNWEYINHDSWGTNFSPQKDLNKDNAQHLELKWAFPIPAASTFVAKQKGRALNEGAIAPPLVVDGVVYLTTKMRNTYAFDAETGKLKWTNVYEKDWEAVVARLPELRSGGGDQHANQYVNGVLYTSQNGCTIYTIDANTGQKKFEIEDICKNVEGNLYNFPGDGSAPAYRGVGKFAGTGHPGAVYRKENVYVMCLSGHDLGGGGRTFCDGYDLNQSPPTRLWRTFLQPPAQGDPEWAIRACNEAKGGWYFSYKAFYTGGKLAINCKDVPRENVVCDWGCPKFHNSAVTNVWGQMAVDEETGLVYFGTGDQGGFGNVTYTTGPNLFAATTMAVDAKTGKIVWWYQQVVRDQVEGDSAWNTILATIGGRKMIIKPTALGGLIWALDAANGEPIWIFEYPSMRSRVDPDGVYRGRTAGIPRIGADPSSQDGFWVDIMSKYEMQEKKWLNYPSKDWFCLYPLRPGESDVAFDPERNVIFAGTSSGGGSCWKVGPFRSQSQLGMAAGLGGVDPAMPVPSRANTTVYAIDATTGKMKWSYFIDGIGFRGGVVTSGGVVFVPSFDGHLYMLDADTGELINKKFFGTGLVVQPTIGKDAKGRTMLFAVTGGNSAVGPGQGIVQAFPGALMAFGLPDKVPQPQEVAREAIKQIPKEQLKEIVKEIPKEVIQEAVGTSEAISPASYAMIGIGAVFLVIAAVLFARRKRV